MDLKLWTAVDDYISDRLLPPDPHLHASLAASAKAGLPAHQVSPPQGKLLHLLARLQGARRILEIGTLGGYSTIWLARALPADGRLVTLEADAHHAEVARWNIDRAHLGDRVELRLGAALDSLAALADEQPEPFDLVFIDADKPSQADYLEWALKLTRRGSLIIGDNVVREGAVIQRDSEDARVRGVQRFLDLLADDPRVEATAIQTVGAKGYDGFALALVVAEA